MTGSPLETLRVAQAPHALLDAVLWTTTLARPLGALETPEAWRALLRLDAAGPLDAAPQARDAVRELLREGGFKPRGRDKPASEALAGAVAAGRLGPEQGINALVDLCNAASLHSGLPMSVVDAELIDDPQRLHITLAAPGTHYIFNPSGQVIDASALLCLHDAQGPCASPVKDSQRTKTSASTQRALWIVWGTRALEGRAEAIAAWCCQELEAQLGATSQRVEVVR